MYLISGTCSIISVSISAHREQNATIWISSLDESWSDWRTGQNWWAGSDHLSSHYWDHPTLFTDYGERLGIK